MANFELQADEVILYEGAATSKQYKGSLQVTLTSHKLILEKEKGIFKKERELLTAVSLSGIKSYNGEAQIRQKGSDVELQATTENITLSFSGILEARKFTSKAIGAATGSTAAKRGSGKVKSALDLIEETTGFDTKGTIKGVLENGVKGTLLNGIGKKK